MKQYTIYCSEEQTKRAYDLEAPIDECSYSINPHIRLGAGRCLIIPTAEQMIGWLNTHDLNVSVFGSEFRGGFYADFHYGICVKQLLYQEKRFVSRKEATLAAIDAALDYLENKGSNNGND